MPGGGYANLDLCERLALVTRRHVVHASSARGRSIRCHGGTTTNDRGQRRPAQQDLRLRRALRGAPRAGSCVARRSRCTTSARSPTDGARRTRSRAHDRVGVPRSPRPLEGTRRSALTSPKPMPDELKCDARSRRSGGASRGRTRHGSADRSQRAPTDLLVYQELIASVRPDWIIETGTAWRWPRVVPRLDLRAPRPRPGRLDQRRRKRDRPEHPRIEYIAASPCDERTGDTAPGADGRRCRGHW